jgi:hypothetical protein
MKSEVNNNLSEDWNWESEARIRHSEDCFIHSEARIRSSEAHIRHSEARIRAFFLFRSLILLIGTQKIVVTNKMVVFDTFLEI